MGTNNNTVEHPSGPIVFSGNNNFIHADSFLVDFILMNSCDIQFKGQIQSIEFLDHCVLRGQGIL